ncbi:MAG: PAS domain S-box protein [Chloroflexi bacterium]|nr:PAS domain S-box protein [Chloroflexota bacterium]
MRNRQGLDALLLAAAVVLGIVVHYGDDLPGLSNLAGAAPWLFLHTVHLPFVVLPVSYAAWAFGLRGGVMVLALTLAGLSPHALMETNPDEQALLGLHLASTAVGAAVAAVAVAQWSRERSIRERNSSQLAASEHKYRALVEHNSEAIFLVDAATGTYLEVNPKACELTGYTREELLRMHVRQLIRPDDAPRGLAQAAQTGFARRESVFVKKDGTEFIGIIAITTFELGGRQVALGSLQDVTETRHLQREVEEREQALREGYHLHLHSLGLALDARNPYTRGQPLWFDKPVLSLPKGSP